MRGVLLTALGTDEAQIEAFFREAISTAKEQKSVSNAQKRPMQNTGGKERAGQEDVDSDYVFGSCLQRSALRKSSKAHPDRGSDAFARGSFAQNRGLAPGLDRRL
jgi:hypothetical protein